MIKIKTQTGCWLDIDDSKLYIQYEIANKFSSIGEFYKFSDQFKNPSYWGDYILECTEDEYRLWITNVAILTLNK